MKSIYQTILWIFTSEATRRYLGINELVLSPSFWSWLSCKPIFNLFSLSLLSTIRYMPISCFLIEVSLTVRAMNKAIILWSWVLCRIRLPIVNFCLWFVTSSSSHCCSELSTLSSPFCLLTSRKSSFVSFWFLFSLLTSNCWFLQKSLFFLGFCYPFKSLLFHVKYLWLSFCKFCTCVHMLFHSIRIELPSTIFARN